MKPLLRTFSVLSLFLLFQHSNAQVGNGYSIPSSGIGLTFRLGPGTCTTISGVIITYPGGLVSLSANSTTYGYLDNTCTLQSNNAGFAAGSVPIFKAITGVDSVSSVVDVRTAYNFGLGGSGSISGPATNGYQVAANGSAFVSQAKLTYDARDQGIDCTGTNDTQPAWQAFINATGDDTTIIVPQNCVMKVGSTITVSSRAGFRLLSYDRAQNGGGSHRPEFLWSGSTGPMWSFVANQAPTVDGFFFTNCGTCHVDSFLLFDGLPAARIGTEAHVIHNTFTNNMANPGTFDSIAIATINSQNHEKNVITDNDFFCSQSKAFRENDSGQISSGSQTLTCGSGTCAFLTDVSVGDRVRVSYATGILDTTVQSITDNNHLAMTASAAVNQTSARMQFRQAYGNGITVGSVNAKHNTFDRNSFTQCARGINMLQGSFSASHLGGSSNDVLLYITDIAEASEADYLEDESSMREVFAGPNMDAPLTLNHLRNSFGGTGEADGFIYFSGGGRFTIIGSLIQDTPTPNAVLIGATSPGQVALTSIGNQWSPGNVTMALLGFSQWRTSAESDTSNVGVLISCGDSGISDAPGGCFQFGEGGSSSNLEGNLVAGSSHRINTSSYSTETAQVNSSNASFVNEAKGFTAAFLGNGNNSASMKYVGFDALFKQPLIGSNSAGFRFTMPTVTSPTTSPFSRGLWVAAPTANTLITTGTGVYVEDLATHTGITNRYSFFGVGATDIAHFGGSVEIGSSSFANLPSSQNGAMIYCSDCNATCTANGGTGRTCFRENGAWTH